MAPEDTFGRGYDHDIKINARISIRKFASVPYIGNRNEDLILIGKAIAESLFCAERIETMNERTGQGHST